MGNDSQKEAMEKSIFFQFINEAKLPIVPDSIENRKPPEPDILCSYTTGEIVAFELVEICDPNLASATPKKVEAAGGALYIQTEDPTGAIISKKLTRSYQTERTIELLCYTNGRVISPDDMLIPKITGLLSNFRSTFARAWLFGEKGVYKLWEAS